MKTLKKIIPTLIIALLLFQSCKDDDTDVVIIPETNTIVDIAVASDDLTSLVAALQKANLVLSLIHI